MTIPKPRPPSRRSIDHATISRFGASGGNIEIGGIWHCLTEGDSFRFRDRTYRWRNPGDMPAVVVWVVSPPVY